TTLALIGYPLRLRNGPAEAYFTTGRPAWRQPSSPPDRLKTSWRPALRSTPTARDDVAPEAQQTSTGLFGGSSPARFSSSASGMLRAFGRCPAANSAGERTSSTTAPESLISRVARSVSSA